LLTRDEPLLLREFCETLVTVGGYPYASVCLGATDGTEPLHLAAECRRPRTAPGAWLTPCGVGARSGCTAPARPQSAAATARSPSRPDRATPNDCLRGGHSRCFPVRCGEERVGWVHVGLDAPGRLGPGEAAALGGLAELLALRLEGLQAATRHRQTKNAVIDTLRRFQFSVQASPVVAVQGLDREGRIRHWNQAATRLFGYAEPDALGRRLADLLFSPKPAAEFDRMLAAAWERGQGTAASEWPARCADGTVRWVFASLIPIRESDRVVELFCMAVDITARRHAEEALRNTEQEYRRLVDVAPLAMLVHQAGVVRLANPAALELLAAPEPDALCLRPIQDLIHPASRGVLEELARSGASRPVALRLVRMDGVAVEAEVAEIPLRWEDRPAVQWVIHDRTATNRLEQELAVAREKLAAIFESSPAAIALGTRAEGRLIETNEAFLRLVGYEREEVLGRTFLDLGIVDASAWRRRLAPRGGGLPLQSSGEIELRTKWRQPRHARISVCDIEVGPQASRLFVLMDVTDRKLLEAELRESQKLEAMSHLARGVAHDLNNILTVIQGHQALISLGPDLPRQAGDALQGISEAVDRAASLTQQLLAFSRKQPFQARPIDLNELLRQLTGLLRRLLGEDIDLVLRPGPGLAPVFADASMLEQVVLNLAVNARDAMPAGGRLTLATGMRSTARPPADWPAAAAEGPCVCLSVRDTGHGIPAEHLPRIFEPFFTTKTRDRGTGLGLATVRSIVQHHRGWIEVRSRPRAGALFRVFLPTAPVAAPRTPARPSAAPADALSGSETVLVVEDEPAVRDLAAQILVRYGYRVFTAGTGPAALKLWRRQGRTVDLVLTDLVLPGGMDGVELARRLKADRAELKVLLSTGYGAGGAGTRRRDMARHEVLAKPYSPEALLRKVRACLDRG
jgi:PAS domain S-box-containing protein